MEIIKTIESLIYPFLAFFIFVFCAVRLRINGSAYLIVAFGINFLSTVLWRIVPFITKILNIQLSDGYEYYNHFALLLFIVSALFFVLGIEFMARSKTSTSNRF
jgi:hypothetical protein